MTYFFQTMNKVKLVLFAALLMGLLITILFSRDRYLWLLNCVLGVDTTTFATQFSEWRYQHLYSGMSVDEVINEIGCPLVVISGCGLALAESSYYTNCSEKAIQNNCMTPPIIYCVDREQETTWRYSYSATDRDYLVRDVIFDKCLIRAKRSYYYYD